MADIGIKIGVEGEKAFKSALKSINDELKVSSSEMQMLAAKYDGSEKSVEGFTEKQKALQKQLATQKEAVETISKALENAKNSFGEADARTLAWEKKLNDAKAQVYKTEKAIEDNNEALGKQRKLTDETKKALTEYAKAAGEKAAKALKALTAAAAASVTAVSALVLSAGNAADELSDMSKKTGLSTTALQKYDYAAKMAGTSLETITGAQAKLVKQMASARDESSSAAKKFAELGVSVKDASGELRNTDDVFMDVIDALGKIDNETERDAAAMDIFGKSAQELNPLILEGSEGLKKYNEEAERLGVIVSEDNVNALADMQGKVKEVTAQFDALKSNLAAKFAPIAKEILEKIQKIITKIADTLDSPKMKSAIDKLGKALKDFLDKAADLAEKILPHLISAVTFVIENFDKLAIAIGAVWAILKGVEVVKAAAKAFDTVKSVMQTLRAATTSAQNAVEGMSSTMSTSSTAAAGWVGVVLAAIAALEIADSALSTEIKRRKEVASEASRELRDEIESAKSTLTGLDERFNGNAAAAEATAKKAGEFIDRLKELEKQSFLTADEQNEYNELVKKLQVLMPELNIELDKNTGYLQDGATALEEQIKNWLALTKLEAAKGALEEAYQNQFKLEKLQEQAATNFREISDLYWRWNELNSKWRSGWKLTTEEHEELLDLTKQLTGENYNYVLSQAAVDEAYTQARDASNEAWNAMQKNKALVEDLEEEYLQLSTAVETSTESVKKQSNQLNGYFASAGVRWGESTGNGIIKGMDSKLPEIEKAARRMAAKVEKGFTDRLEIRSPSRVMFRETGFVGDAVVLSLINARREVEAASSSLARAVEAGFDPSVAASVAASPAASMGGSAAFAAAGNTYNYYVSDPSPAFYEAVMSGVDQRFGGLYA